MRNSWWTGFVAGAALGGCAVGLSIGGFHRSIGSASNAQPAAGHLVAAQVGPASRNPFLSPRREEEWKEAELFMEEHAPHYLRKIQALSLSEQRLRQLHSTMISRYQLLQRMKEHFNELYEIRVRQLELFDLLFNTHEQYLAAGEGERERLRIEMKRRVAELFENSLKDRHTRIDRLHDMLGKLSTSVDADAKNQDKIVESHFQTVLARGVDPSLLDGLVKDDSESPTGGERKLRKLLAPSTSPTN